jgi:hypothetical protein
MKAIAERFTTVMTGWKGDNSDREDKLPILRQRKTTKIRHLEKILSTWRARHADLHR